MMMAARASVLRRVFGFTRNRTGNVNVVRERRSSRAICAMYAESSFFQRVAEVDRHPSVAARSVE